MDVGVHVLDGMDQWGDDTGQMSNMDWQQCFFHCLIIGCKAVAWLTDTHSFPHICHYKSKVGGATEDANINVYIKAVDRACVAGFSCYVLLTKDDGKGQQEAATMCEAIGATLAEFETRAEVDALLSAGVFKDYNRGLWVGLQYNSTAWTWTNAGPATWIPWKNNQPTSTLGVNSVIADPNDMWKLTSGETRGFPLCELPGAVSQVRNGAGMRELCDDNLSTCFTPTSRRQAASTILQTQNMLLGSFHMIVKVQGDCDVDYTSDVTRASFHVMVAAVLGSSEGQLYHFCERLGCYLWKSKQLCLYQCQCQQTELCKAAFLKINYTAANIPTICEFVVL